jgi:hypothetical protein
MLVVRQVKVLAVEAADSVVEAVMTSEEVEVTSVVSQENLLNGGAQAGAQGGAQAPETLSHQQHKKVVESLNFKKKRVIDVRGKWNIHKINWKFQIWIPNLHYLELMDDISEPLSITFSSLRTRTLTDASYYSTSGTFTITGGSYALFAEAISQSNSTVTVLTTINGLLKCK